MPQFIVKAQNSKKKIVKLTIEAGSRAEVARKIKSKGMTPIEINEQRGGSKGGAKPKLDLKNIQIGGPKKAKPLEVVIFCRQLAIAVSAGLPLRDALEGITKSLDPNTLSSTILPATEALHSGISFSESLTRANKFGVFSPVFLGLIRVAEETGTMADTLQKLADYLDDSAKLSASIKSKLSYPVFMIVAFVSINIGATFFLFPMFEKNFASLGGSLPPLTMWVFDLNNTMLAIAPYGISIFILLFLSFIFYRKTPSGRVVVDSKMLKLPLLGQVILRIGLARFCKTLAITASGGVPLVQGLEISSVVVGNKHIETSLNKVKEEVMNGNRFANTLRNTGNFPDLVVRMIDVGEDSGQLPLVLEKIADIYETEVANSIAKMLALIEPCIILLFGVFVTVMVLALYMPVFSMSG